MCGIVGFTGLQQAAPVLLDGLSKLEYRGYDSAGLAVRDGDALAEVVKATGKLKNLAEKTDYGTSLPGTCGIGHTRWATHGEPTQTNAHPHVGGNAKGSACGPVESDVVGVHNGIIENYEELKAKLMRHGYSFYRTTDTDMTILLSHIGIEQDRRLAELLDPEWGVNFIIGGHSHTFMDAPEVINGVPIVQAGTGTDIIGKIDIEFDKDEQVIKDYKWECVPINEDTCTPDPVMAEMIGRYQSVTDAKYKRVVTRLARKLTHPSREQETELGNLYADMMQDESSFDIMMFGSGAIRKKELGPLVEYQDMLENTPFDDVVWMFEVTGDQFRKMVLHILRDDAWLGETEFYQFSRGVKIKYRKSTHSLEELKYNGDDITADTRLKIGLQNYHYKNFDEFLGIPLEEVKQNWKPRVVATSVNNIVEEYLATHQGLDAQVEGRLEILD